MKNIDLKLLAVINELHRTRNVSQTAENLALSQSAVSMSLAKLRKHFHDPLFVRTSNGMEPTPHASELIEMLKKAQDLLQMAMGHHVVFHPRTSDRIFRLYSPDIAQVTLIPKLLRRLRDVAPSVRLDLRRISDATPRMLESGAADLAVGFIPPMGAGFCQQSLFKDRFVGAVRRNHPRIEKALSLEQFQNELHLAVSITASGHSLLDKMIESKGIQRKVSLTVPSFLGIASILAGADYVAVLPGQLAEHLARSGNIKVVRLPFHLPQYVIAQHWHERYTHDPAVRWLRGEISELFSEQNVVGNGNSDNTSSTRRNGFASSAEKSETVSMST